MDDKKNKTLGYQPEIEYQDEYYSEHVAQEDVIENQPMTSVDDLYDNSILFSIDHNINNIIVLLDGLPEKLQTAINQVFKPIYNEWKKDLQNRNYPTRIPDPNTPIIIQKDPWDPQPGWPWPKPPEDDDPGNDDPGDDDPGNDDPGDDDPGGDDPGNDDPGDDDPSNDDPGNNDPGDDDDDDGGGGTPPGGGNFPGDIEIWTPEPGDIIPDPEETIEPKPGTIPEDFGDFFSDDTPFIVEYEVLTDLEIIELEYSKNLLELFQYYTNKLNDMLCNHTANQFSAYATASMDRDFIFLLNDVTLDDIGVEKDYKHLIDVALRNEVIGNNKLDFSLNTFPVESTLYHIKNLKTSHTLRKRYVEQNILSSDNGGSLSNSFLRGIKASYNKKYQTAYINLYKYLNSQTKVLEDVFKTLDTCLRAKETLIKKGGYKK